MVLWRVDVACGWVLAVQQWLADGSSRCSGGLRMGPCGAAVQPSLVQSLEQLEMTYAHGCCFELGPSRCSGVSELGGARGAGKQLDMIHVHTYCF